MCQCSCLHLLSFEGKSFLARLGLTFPSDFHSVNQLDKSVEYHGRTLERDAEMPQNEILQPMLAPVVTARMKAKISMLTFGMILAATCSVLADVRYVDVNSA